MSQKEKILQGDKDGTMRMGKVSISEIREKVKERLGIDPLANLGVEKRLLYLQKVCNSLPPSGSEERERQRTEDGLAVSISRNRAERAKIFDLDTYVQHSRTQSYS